MTKTISIPAHNLGQRLDIGDYDMFEDGCAAVRRQAPRCTSDFAKFESFTIEGGRFHNHGDAKMARRVYSALVEAVSASFAAVVFGEGATFAFPFEGQMLTGVGGPLRGRTAEAGGDRDRFPVLSVMAMQAFHRGDRDWEAAIDRAEAAMDPAQIRIATPAIARVEKTLLEVMRAVGRHDQAGFTAAIVEALKAHKAFWTKGANKHSCHGALCLPVSGFAALGVDRGLKFEVDSGYAPRWLVEGTQP